jgi:shikimate dehydrogenase
MLGAGGAAAAALTAIEDWSGAKVLLANRGAERGKALAARFGAVASIADTARIAREADLVVNATSVGLRDEQLPIQPQLLERAHSALDMVYRPGETTWVRECRGRGLRAVDGLWMLVEQGALAFERWFGVHADRGVMEAAVAALAGRRG